MELSIITINYNNREGLRKTIESVIDQTWQEFEWIIVDGGSSDGSKELIEDIAHQQESQGWNTENFSLLGFTAKGKKTGSNQLSPGNHISSQRDTERSLGNSGRVLKWTSEKDNGIYNAMNKGIVTAKGEYCLFLNSGDRLYDSSVLASVLQCGLTKDFEYGSLIVEEGEKQILWEIPLEKLSSAWKFYQGTLPHPATFIRRKVFKQLGMYDESLKIFADWKFFVKAIVYEQASVGRLPYIISTFEDGGISSLDSPIRASERKLVRNEMFPPMIDNDYKMLMSLYEVWEFGWSKKIYSLLYRAVIMWRSIKARLS